MCRREGDCLMSTVSAIFFSFFFSLFSIVNHVFSRHIPDFEILAMQRKDRGVTEAFVLFMNEVSLRVFLPMKGKFNSDKEFPDRSFQSYMNELKLFTIVMQTRERLIEV
jgi:hypothetical protein